MCTVLLYHDKVMTLFNMLNYENIFAYSITEAMQNVTSIQTIYIADINYEYKYSGLRPILGTYVIHATYVRYIYISSHVIIDVPNLNICILLG